MYLYTKISEIVTNVRENTQKQWLSMKQELKYIRLPLICISA